MHSYVFLFLTLQFGGLLSGGGSYVPSYYIIIKNEIKKINCTQYMHVMNLQGKHLHSTRFLILYIHNFHSLMSNWWVLVVAN